jgi:hypothetical protein
MRESIEKGKEKEKKEVGKIEREGKTQKWELISITFSNCGMINLCGLSRIHNIKTSCLLHWAMESSSK